MPTFFFLPVVMLTLVINFYLLLFTPLGVSRAKIDGQTVVLQNKFNFYAVLPAVLGIQNSSFFTADDRPRILENFIKKYFPDSPLLPYTYYFVETADRYGLHYTLLVAIAMQESHLCKYTPPNSNNCWGLGVYGDKVWRFDTYEEGISALGKTLSRYQTKGRVEPEEIMKLYTPGSDGSWARAVDHFMDEMQEAR